MELRDLQKMTVVKLREEGLKYGSIIGVHGMSKQELIAALAPIHGIDLEAQLQDARARRAPSKGALKQEIQALKTQRDEALTEGDVAALSKARKDIKKRKRHLRRLAEQSKGAVA